MAFGKVPRTTLPVPTHSHSGCVTLFPNDLGIDQVIPSSWLVTIHTSVLLRVCGTMIFPVLRSSTGAALPMTVGTLVAFDSVRTTESEDHVVPLSSLRLTTRSVQAKSLHVTMRASAKARRRPDMRRRRAGILIHAYPFSPLEYTTLEWLV